MNRPRARDPQQDAAWLTAALHEQADEHQADADRIKTGFERQIAGEPRRVRARRLSGPLRLRLVGVPLGILAAMAAATVAVGVSLGITARPTHPASHSAPSSSLSVTQSARQPSPQTASNGTHPAAAGSATTRSTPAPPSTSAGPLTVVAAVDSHSTQFWAQENLTVTTTRVIRDLHVVVSVSGGSTVQSTGWWATIGSADLDTTVKATPGGLEFDIALKPGQTLQPGSYAFGCQFNRPASGHSFASDAYHVTTAATYGASQTGVSGTFSD